MKKMLTSASLVALSAASLHAAYAPNMTSMEKQKPWSISASLRGFYDDNYTTSPKALARESYGFELSPSASLNLPLDQTFIGASYTYAMRYYFDRNNNRADHSHVVNAKLDHAFSERYKVELSDSFAIAQEPEILNPSSGPITFPLRTEGNNLRNQANINFTAQLTQILGLEVGYMNTLYDYEQSGLASRSALLDRMEHLASVNLRWQVLPKTVGIFGYQYGQTDYSSNDPIFIDPVFGPVSGKLRDTRSHYIYAGVDQNINSQLNGSVRVGAQYTDFHKLSQDTWNPYVDGNLTYTYLPGSYLQVGVRHQRNSTDVAGGSVAGLTVDQESTSVYASLSHKITAELTGTLLGQYQHSVFNGGTANDLADDFYVVGANLNYQFNPHLSAEAGYNFDRLDSDLGGRSYTRNRGYIGLRATY
jgi:hypothetical protein